MIIENASDINVKVELSKEINLNLIKGTDGRSAYEVAVENGFTGTEAEWLESLKGEFNPATETFDTLDTTDKTILGAINENFTNVSNGKTLIASAVTDKGVTTSNTDTFSTMASNIGNITTGYPIGTDGLVTGDVVIPDSVTSLGNYAFAYQSITSVSGANNVVTLGVSVFYSCTSLATVSLPSATTLGSNAFYNCSNLTTVSLPSATTFEDNAFNYCTSLATVSLPSATTLGKYAFNSCTSLATVSLPSATTLGMYAFISCAHLQNIDFGGRNNVVTLTSRLYLKSDYLTDASFLEVANALVDNSAGGTITIYVKTVAWSSVPQTTKDIFTTKNYTISAS